ncbi:hypothetical protein [Spiroplasma endosymbiont of 'Nebria riversi']|uniref:hypothetical protein n=1 Tax=Spiroplasma endosymbiont of 'Nebria riversi' TaxID=2792084 RepID=UPI001C04E5DE|nr:hypothetical protein [Spiroplasma endosymbiont of 'Nebria riversi']
MFLVTGNLQNGQTTWVMLGLIIIIVVVMIVSSIRKRKQDKIEKEKRQKEVRDKIKQYLKINDNIAHKRIEYDKVIARAGKDYKYRDVFDIVIKLYDSKSNALYATKAFEVEGLTKQLSKKEYETTWKVNHELELEATLIRLQKEQKKNYWKMTKAERAQVRLERKEAKIIEKAEIKKIKQEKKIKATKKVVQNKNEVLIKRQPNEKFGAKK